MARSMTYGNVPPLDEFKAAFLAEFEEDEDATYEITCPEGSKDAALVSSANDQLSDILRVQGKVIRRNGDRVSWKYPLASLYALVKILTSMWESGDDTAGDWASGILSTLHFEWV